MTSCTPQMSNSKKEKENSQNISKSRHLIGKMASSFDPLLILALKVFLNDLFINIII